MSNKQEKPSMANKVFGLIGAGMIGLAAGFGGGVTLMPSQEPVVITEMVEVPVEVIKEVPVNQTVIKEVEVIKEVDNGKLDYLKESLIDRDIVDDEFDVVKVFMAEDEALSRAIIAIEDELADMLEDENIMPDEDEVSIYRIYSDWEDVTVKRSDFDNERYKFEIKVRVEDNENNVEKKVLVTVEIDEDEVELKSVVEL